MGNERDYRWLTKKMGRDEMETQRAKRKFIKEMKNGLGETIKENTHTETKPKEKTFTEDLLFRLKRVFG